MQGMPSPNSVEIISKSFAGVRAGASRNKSEHKQRVGRAALILWNDPKVTENVKNQESRPISLACSGLPGGVDHRDKTI